MPPVVTARVAVPSIGAAIDLSFEGFPFHVVAGMLARVVGELEERANLDEPVNGVAVADDQREQLAPVEDLDERREAPPISPKTKTPKNQAPAAPSAVEGGFVCDVCGKPAVNAQGLGLHRKRAHGIAGKHAGNKQPKAAAAATAALGIADDVEALRCDDCDHVVAVDKIEKLRTHVMSDHGGRFLRGSERTPRTAAQAAERSA